MLQVVRDTVYILGILKYIGRLLNLNCLTDALRAIFGRRRSNSVQDIFSPHSLLPVNEQCRLRVALLAFKMYKGITPQDISFPITAVVKRSARRENTFVMPTVFKESSRQSLAYRLPSVWGSLPREVRSLSSTKMFIREAKKCIINT